MKKIGMATVVAVLALWAWGAGPAQAQAQAPEYTSDGGLKLPENYREWVWLSSGLGMSYGPAAQSSSAAEPPFDNVFVKPEAYRSFLQTGTWPDKTMFVLEIRSSLSKGSINQSGHYQGELRAVEAEVKDASRFPGKWAFFAIGAGKTGKLLPPSATCYSCHAQNGAVDNTFVQFYPALLEVARQKGTVK